MLLTGLRIITSGGVGRLAAYVVCNRAEASGRPYLAWHFVMLCVLVSCAAGDHPIAGDRLKRYLAIGASLANARAHKVRQ